MRHCWDAIGTAWRGQNVHKWKRNWFRETWGCVTSGFCCRTFINSEKMTKKPDMLASCPCDDFTFVQEKHLTFLLFFNSWYKSIWILLAAELSLLLTCTSSVRTSVRSVPGSTKTSRQGEAEKICNHCRKAAVPQSQLSGTVHYGEKKLLIVTLCWQQTTNQYLLLHTNTVFYIPQTNGFKELKKAITKKKK